MNFIMPRASRQAGGDSGLCSAWGSECGENQGVLIIFDYLKSFLMDVYVVLTRFLLVLKQCIF